jgi:hypothetical protein
MNHVHSIYTFYRVAEGGLICMPKLLILVITDYYQQFSISLYLNPTPWNRTPSFFSSSSYRHSFLSSQRHILVFSLPSYKVHGIHLGNLQNPHFLGGRGHCQPRWISPWLKVGVFYAKFITKLANKKMLTQKTNHFFLKEQMTKTPVCLVYSQVIDNQKTGGAWQHIWEGRVEAKSSRNPLQFFLNFYL